MSLTVRQRQFAKLVASGVSQTDARLQAFGESYPPVKRRTYTEKASRLANRPQVKAAILAYEEQIAPIASYRALREEMERNMRALATGAADERVRLAASKLLHQIAVEREERERSARSVTVDRLISEIGQLSPQAPTIELESVPIDEATETDSSDD